MHRVALGNCKVKAISVFLVLSSLLVSTTVFAGVLEDIIREQKEVKTLRAEFHQEKHTLLLERPVMSEGVFYYSREAGVRWEYDDGMLMVYDGDYLYVYNPGTREAERLSGAPEVLGPLNFDLELLSRDFEIRAEESGGGALLTLRPTKEMPFNSMELAFPEGSPFPREVRMRQETGESTVIGFHDLAVNEPLAGGLFVFTPPPGVNIRNRDINE